MSKPYLFHKFQRVRHVKSGKEYEIRATPDEARIEKGWEPSYLYGDDEIKYISRSQAEMEDGRFVAVELKDLWRQPLRRTADAPGELDGWRTADPLPSDFHGTCSDVACICHATVRALDEHARLNSEDPRPDSFGPSPITADAIRAWFMKRAISRALSATGPCAGDPEGGSVSRRETES